MQFRSKTLLLCLVTLFATTLSLAAPSGMPKPTNKIGNVNVVREVSPKGNVSYWATDKARYDQKSDTVNITQYREDDFGKIVQIVTYDSPCAHRKYMQLETTVDDPAGPNKKTLEWWSSDRKMAHTDVSIRITDAVCPAGKLKSQTPSAAPVVSNGPIKITFPPRDKEQNANSVPFESTGAVIQEVSRELGVHYSFKSEQLWRSLAYVYDTKPEVIQALKQIVQRGKPVKLTGYTYTNEYGDKNLDWSKPVTITSE